MQEMQPESVDLILCDPPYGTIKGLGKYSAEQYMQTKNTQWDEIIPTADLFAGFFRVLRNNGALVLFSQEPYTSHIRTHRVENLNFCYPMIYEKTTTGNPLKAKIAPLSFFEDVSVWRKRVDVTDEAHPLRDYARRLVEWMGKDYKQVAKDFEAKGIEKPTRAQHFLGWNCRQWHLCTAETYDLLIEFYGIHKWGGVCTVWRTIRTRPKVFERKHTGRPDVQHTKRARVRVKYIKMQQRFEHVSSDTKAA